MPPKKEFKILDTKIEAGSRVTLNLDIARLHTRTKVEVPVIIERAKEDGPVLLIIGGIHGNEVNGVEIVRQIISKGINKPEKGVVICMPVLNVFGFLNQKREFPDGRDLNRVFPGSKEGSLASRFAYYVMKEIIPKVDYCIDFHTGGAARFNYTHIRVDERDAESFELARAFKTPFIMYAKKRDKSLRDEATKLGKKVLLFEGGKSLYLDKIVTKIGIEGTMRMMQHLGMRNFGKEASGSTLPEPIIIKKSSWVRAKYSGMFRSFVSVGEKVKKGRKLGSITDPFGDFEKTVICPHDGYMICANHSPIVTQGDALFHIGFES